MTSISIIGASGAVGSTLATHILRSGLLQYGDRLQLVARGVESSSAKLLSMRIDLMDAFDDQGVDIEVIANIEDMDGDIVVVCAGVSSQGKLIDRREWGRANCDLYESIAETCLRRVPNAFFIIVSNPVELAVRIFSEKLGRRRVVGMGAEQDSLRFSRAIAHDLGMSRHDVFASVLGEHGQAMVPLWSSVELNTTDERLLVHLEAMRIQSDAIPLEQRVAELRSSVMNFLEKGLVNEAYEATRRSLPDARIFVQPQITWNTIHSTPNATANSTLRFLTRLLHAEDQRPLHAQVLLSGDFWGIHGVCGVPVTINSDGWRVREIESLAGEERLRILDATASIERYITEVRSAALDTVVFQAASDVSMASSSIALSEDIFENSASLCTT
jgi:malate dehydrogenase